MTNFFHYLNKIKNSQLDKSIMNLDEIKRLTQK